MSNSLELAEHSQEMAAVARLKLSRPAGKTNLRMLMLNQHDKKFTLETNANLAKLIQIIMKVL